MSEFPEPLVPSEVDLRDFAFMPLDVVRLRDSGLTAKATGDEFRAAVLLWCASWHQVPAASLPDDEEELANLCGYGRAIREWKKVRDGALRGWVKCSDGRLYHEIVGEKAKEAWTSKLAQRARTEAARKARDEARQKQLQQQSQSLSQTPELSVTDNVTESKGQGQGQGQGQGEVNPTDACASVSAQFELFWKTWPKSDRKVDKAKCLKAWGKNRLDPIAEQVIAHVEAMKASEQWLSGFEPAPLTYLNGKRWLDPLPERSYSEQELQVIRAYNDILTPAGWPEAVTEPYSRDRASAIAEFLTFSMKPNWIVAYFDWMSKNMPAKLGWGFEWAIGRESYIRAKEGNFRALQEAA